MVTTATSPDDSEPALSPAVAAALADADETSDWISHHHPEDVLETRNHQLAARYFGITIEHRQAALLLISQHMRTSALALWRPTYESYMRGHWALNVAGDKDFEQMAKTRAVPKFDTVIKALDATAKSSMFAKNKAKLWNPMSDFAHGGLGLLAQWSLTDGIGSNHPDHEVLHLVTRLNVYGLLATMGLNSMAGDKALPDSIFRDKVSAVLTSIEAQTSASPAQSTV